MALGEHDCRLMSGDRHVALRGFDPYRKMSITRRRLPHWHQPGVAYFITFRLADSLPQPLLRQWRDERAIWRDGILNRGCRQSRANMKSGSAAAYKDGWMQGWAGATCDGQMSDVRSSLACC